MATEQTTHDRDSPIHMVIFGLYAGMVTKEVKIAKENRGTFRLRRDRERQGVGAFVNGIVKSWEWLERVRHS
jgi:hypothetical protein